MITARLKELITQVYTGEITLSRMSEIINEDMETFSVWAYNSGWYYSELTEAWYNSEQMDDTKHTIEEVLKLWEQEGRAK